MIKKTDTKIRTVLICALTFLLMGCSSYQCDRCGNNGAKAYTLSDGSVEYVCRECSSKCEFCGEKAVTHYESLLGVNIFVCQECYDYWTN